MLNWETIFEEDKTSIKEIINYFLEKNDIHSIW